MTFTKALQTFGLDMKSILDIMKLRRDPEEIDALCDLLITVNLITDHYLNRKDDSLRITTVYFPVCNEKAQEICEEFVCLKFGLFTNQKWKTNVVQNFNSEYSYEPEELKTKKQRALHNDYYNYEKALCGILSKSINVYYGYGRTFIYSEYLNKCYTDYLESNKKYSSRTVNKYWYLNKAITNNINNKDACPLSLVPESSKDLYNYLTSNEEGNNVENIIVFPTKTPDGRYSEYCSDAFQKPYFDDFVSSSSGLRNVFFFCFSKKPYRLRRLIDFKQRMKERIQLFEKDTFDFISFTYNESLILNSKEEHRFLSIDLGINSSDIQQAYEEIFDDITNGLDRNVARRNEMSLCIPIDSSSMYSQKLVDETEANEDILNEIFRFNAKLWNDEASVKVLHFINNEDIFIVTGNDIDRTLRDKFGKFLRENYNARKVSFGTFGDFRGYLVKGKYVNRIKEKKIMIVSFRNDYSDSIFHKYPNSFDPICINPNQKLLIISNYFLMRQYFEWGKYNYCKTLKKILQSDFRSSKMRPIIGDHKKPMKNLPEDTREEEMDRNTYRGIQQIQVTYADNSTCNYSRSEWILYKYANNTGIAPLSDLCDLYESPDRLQIQPLTPLVKYVKNDYVDAEKEKDTQSEKWFKQQPQYGLKEDEINSRMQLWKILLFNKTAKSSLEEVYADIMSHFNERDKISFSSFKKWFDTDYGIPRARKMQKYLIEDYLNIKSPYINIIRRIKERNKSDTESININIRHFLNTSLLANNYTDVFSSLNDEIKDLLDISNADDIERIINNVKTNIKFQPIKDIRQ